MPKFKFNKNALGGIITEDKVTEDTETVGKKLIWAEIINATIKTGI